MKQGTSMITFVISMLAIALACYFGYYVWDTFSTPYTTAKAYSYAANDSVETTGLLIREEQALPAQNGIVDLLRGEGEKVGEGQTIALVYQNGEAQQAQTEQDALAREIEALEYALKEGNSTLSEVQIDKSVFQSVVGLHSSVALQDYRDLEKQVIAAKSGVLKQAYTYGEALSVTDLETKLQDLKSQLDQLESKSATATTRVNAPASGVFSVLLDGYESITPDQLFELDRPNLQKLLKKSQTAPENPGMGKMITSAKWYFAAPITTEESLRMQEGKLLTTRFSGDFSQDVTMKIERMVSDSDGAVIVLSAQDYLPQTTLLRRQTAELIFESVEGIRVPKAALHMETEGEGTASEPEEHIFGVYALVNQRAMFKKVEIISEGSDYYILKAADDGKRTLLAGDEILVRGRGLYDGKLMIE